MSNGIGDFISSKKEVKRLAAQVIAELKGDVPGHEFHGNQYSDGGGSSGGDSGKNTVSVSGSTVTLNHGGKGHIKMTDQGDNTLAIDDAYVFNPEDRGKGIGKEMYSGLFDYAKSNGKKIVSGKTVENPAAKIWQKMKRDGYPVKIDPDAHEAEGGGYWHANEKPVFSIDFRKD